MLVTATGDGRLLDRRRIELVDEDLPKIPHHSEGQALPLDEAVALVERVRVSAERHAKLGLDAVAMRVSGRILGVALRQCPGLPPTIAERIKDYQPAHDKWSRTEPHVLFSFLAPQAHHTTALGLPELLLGNHQLRQHSFQTGAGGLHSAKGPVVVPEAPALGPDELKIFTERMD